MQMKDKTNRSNSDWHIINESTWIHTNCEIYSWLQVEDSGLPIKGLIQVFWSGVVWATIPLMIVNGKLVYNCTAGGQNTRASSVKNQTANSYETRLPNEHTNNMYWHIK